MKTAGIIAEYNPFHKGHEYQLQQIREALRADYTVIVMSGDYVQRGAPALLEKHARAEMALRCGADLVLELPVRFSTASAESFAMGGVSILDGIGVTDCLCFGAEDVKPAVFSQTAQILEQEPEPYLSLLRQSLREGMSFPAARCRALSEVMTSPHDPRSRGEIQEFLSRPNNILGLEYLKALRRLKSSITPIPMKREGAGYHQLHPDQEEFPSAAAVRGLIFSGAGADTEDPAADLPLSSVKEKLLSRFLPPEALAILSRNLKEGSVLSHRDLDPLLQYRLMSETADSLKKYADVSSQLAQRILRMRNHFESFSSFAEMVHSRDLTQTRAQRALLHILLGMSSPASGPVYARVLGFRGSAAPLLREIRKRTRIPFFTKAADASHILDPASMDIFEESLRASMIYEGILSQKTKKAFRHEFEKPLVILRE